VVGAESLPQPAIIKAQISANAEMRNA
jgi:hypothetical protein